MPDLYYFLHLEQFVLLGPNDGAGHDPITEL